MEFSRHSFYHSHLCFFPPLWRHENILCEEKGGELLLLRWEKRANLAMSLWSSSLCCWSSAAMACWACCCIPCTKCCMCWKASIWKDTKQTWIRRYERSVLSGLCGVTPPTRVQVFGSEVRCFWDQLACRRLKEFVQSTHSSAQLAFPQVREQNYVLYTQAPSWRQWLKETGVEFKSYLWTIIWLFCFHCFSIVFFSFFLTFLITLHQKKRFVCPKANVKSMLTLEHCLECSGSIIDPSSFWILPTVTLTEYYTYITDRPTVTSCFLFYFHMNV